MPLVLAGFMRQRKKTQQRIVLELQKLQVLKKGKVLKGGCSIEKIGLKDSLTTKDQERVGLISIEIGEGIDCSKRHK